MHPDVQDDHPVLKRLDEQPDQQEERAAARITADPVEPSDHFDGRRFVNTTGPAAQPFSAVPRMLREPRTPWPARLDEPPRRPPALDGADAVVTFIGHATFLIQTAAGNILTDPMYSRRAGPFNMLGPRRVRQPAVRTR